MSAIVPRSIFIEFFFARNRIWSKVGRCFGSSSQHSIINLKWIFNWCFGVSIRLASEGKVWLVEGTIQPSSVWKSTLVLWYYLDMLQNWRFEYCINGTIHRYPLVILVFFSNEYLDHVGLIRSNEVTTFRRQPCVNGQRAFDRWLFWCIYLSVCAVVNNKYSVQYLTQKIWPFNFNLRT